MKDVEIFSAARDIEDPVQRNSYLRQACGDDQTLRLQIEKMLELAENSGSFMEFSKQSESTSGAESEIAAIHVGAVIGPYKLREKIGEGGMGVVYVAEQIEPVRRRVALKIIKPGMDSQQVIARFEAERQALAMMDHPHIARVLDAGTTAQGLPYFVMELVNGTPIDRYCDEHRLTIRERLELFRAVCEGVQHAHQKGIIHRDLKPSNIIVAQYDGRPVPKVIDFGVAKATGQTLSDHSVYTQLGQIVGTLEYMSPEQAQRNQLDIDTRSDIYSLGVVLYKLLTGELPFDKSRLRSVALDELFRIIREEEPPRPSTRFSTSGSKVEVAKNRQADPAKLGAMFRGELDWIVAKAIDKDRQRRYETANGLALDVQRFLENEPVQACPPSTRYRLQKFWRRNRTAVLGTGAVAVVLILASGISARMAYLAKQSEHKATLTNDQLTSALKELEQSQTRVIAERNQVIEERNQVIEERNRADRNLGFLLTSIGSPFVLGKNATVMDLVTEISKGIDKRFKDDPESRCRILHWIIGIDSNFGQDPRLADTYDRLISACTEAYGPYDSRTLDARLRVAPMLPEQTAEEVCKRLERILQEANTHLGANHQVTLRCMFQLGYRYGDPDAFPAKQLGVGVGTSYDKAIELLTKVDTILNEAEPDQLEIKRSDFDPNLRRLIGHILTKAGQPERAIDYLDREIERLEHLNGVSVYELAGVHETRAEAYRNMGQVDIAIRLLEEFAESVELRYLQTDAMMALAEVCRQAGRFRKAADALRKVYEIEEYRVFLESPQNYLIDHADLFGDKRVINPNYVFQKLMGSFRWTLHAVWESEGDDSALEESIDVTKRFLEKYPQIRSPDDISMIRTRLSLALYFSLLGRCDESISEFEAGFSLLESKYGVPDDWFYGLSISTFTYKLAYAECLINVDRQDEALPILEELTAYIANISDSDVEFLEKYPYIRSYDLELHLLAYCRFKTGQQGADIETELTGPPTQQIARLEQALQGDPNYESIRQRFAWRRLQAVQSIERVIEYFEASQQPEKVEAWKDHLQHVEEMQNPNLPNTGLSSDLTEKSSPLTQVPSGREYVFDVGSSSTRIARRDKSTNWRRGLVCDSQNVPQFLISWPNCIAT